MGTARVAVEEVDTRRLGSPAPLPSWKGNFLNLTPYGLPRTSDTGLRDNYNVLGDSNNSTEVAARERKMKLNQIHTRENNLLNVSGAAHLDAKVEVSGRNVLAARQGRYWNDALIVGNVLRPWRGPLTIFAAQQNGGPGGTTDLVRTDVRLAQLPQALQTFEYDDDGNLTTDGVWDYLWDAENRIVRMTTTTLAVQGGYPNRRLEFKYDYLGRRVQKRVLDHVANQLVSAARFIYEGWHMIGEYTDTGATLPGAIKRSYTWGLDIVHTREKAGGVGALLQIADCVGSKGYFAAYDGNGNVVALFDGAPSGGSAGARVVAYEYSPFGEILRSEGGYAAENPVRFSTKFTDDESGLVYYGRRYYSPSQGRFLGRDPKGEAGGTNLYAFVRNNPTSAWDYLGMTMMGAVSSHTKTEREFDENGCEWEVIYSDISDVAYGIPEWVESGRTKIFCPPKLIDSDPSNGSGDNVEPAETVDDDICKQWRAAAKSAGSVLESTANRLSRNLGVKSSDLWDMVQNINTWAGVGTGVASLADLMQQHRPPTVINGRYGPISNGSLRGSALPPAYAPIGFGATVLGIGVDGANTVIHLSNGQYMSATQSGASGILGTWGLFFPPAAAASAAGAVLVFGIESVGNYVNNRAEQQSIARQSLTDLQTYQSAYRRYDNATAQLNEHGCPD